MSDDANPSRRKVLAGASALGAGVELLAYTRPVQATGLSTSHFPALQERYKRSIVIANAAYDAHTPCEDAFQAQGGFELSGDEAKALKEATGLDKAEAIVAAAEQANWRAIEEIITTPANSIAELRVKAEVSRAEGNNVPELIDSIIDDLIRMGA